MDAVATVIGMHVLLFVLHVCMLRECEGERVTAMLVWECGAVSAGCDCMGVACGSFGYDVPEMRVVRRVRVLGGVCLICMCLARGVVCKCVRGLGLGFTNPVGTGGLWDMCLCPG